MFNHTKYKIYALFASKDHSSRLVNKLNLEHIIMNLLRILISAWFELMNKRHMIMYNQKLGEGYSFFKYRA